MANIRNGFSRFSPKGLWALLSNVIAKLTENATTFTDLPVKLTALTVLSNDFGDAINKATKGSEVARAARGNKQVEVKAALTATADYVRMVAGGNAEVLASSGFEMMKNPVPVGRVEPPLMKSSKMTGVVGEAELVWSKVPGAYSYQVYRTDSDPAETAAVWLPVLATTKVRCFVTGLTPYKAYWFSVQALAAAGTSALSDPSIGRAA